MSSILKSITVNNFRSIRGEVTIPLDSPVVLVFGQNGAGKTSALSAIELALTGELSAMKRSDAAYASHLRHKGEAAGSVALSLELAANVQQSARISLGPNGLSGVPLLAGERARFFSERCYLAQATLGRLLEIYQHASSKEGSPLLRFVKDLLGLGELDALIDGLAPVGDVRNVRKLVVEYGLAERQRDDLAQRIAKAKQVREEIGAQVSVLAASLREMIGALGADVGADQTASVSVAALVPQVDLTNEDTALAEILAHKRDLDSVRARVTSLMGSPYARNEAQALESMHQAESGLQAWRAASGGRIQDAIASARRYFPDLPSIESTDPVVAVQTAASRIQAEHVRCKSLIEEDEKLVTQAQLVADAIAHSNARLQIINDQASQLVSNAGGLARVLASLLPHVHGNDCPVCDRDYGELQTGPLQSKVADKIAVLTEQSELLGQLEKARLEASNDLVASGRSAALIQSRRLASDAKAQLSSRAAELLDLRVEISSLGEAAQTGANLVRVLADAQEEIAALRNRDTVLSELRSVVVTSASVLKQRAPAASESLLDVVNRLDAHVSTVREAVEKRRALKTRIKDAAGQLETRSKEIAIQEGDLRNLEAQRGALLSAIRSSEEERDSAKLVLQAATRVRSQIVSRVFNSALNRVWKDLFIRLAPSEPFVPAFRLPETPGEPISAHLETLHTTGERAGSPGSMLSAGNLNTAALTLFLALHLSVTSELPLLILDDPVQSMDDVHVAQFAALLRTLSKEHGRQIVIAVHDRQLFDYLRLELSPAFAGDRLIAVELARSEGENTSCSFKIDSWEADAAVAA